MSEASSSKRALLEELTFGERVAEEEREALTEYFVQTDQWRRVVAGEVDVVFGNKGAGKSAIYASLLAREDELFDEGILLIPGEKPRGAPVFQGLVAEPPTSENEFVGLWKLYILSLLASALKEYGVPGSESRKVQEALAKEGLLPSGDLALSSRFRLVLDWVQKNFRPNALESELKLDPATGAPVALLGRITLSEPNADALSRGYQSLDGLLRLANTALEHQKLRVWVLFDRLDVAFAESRTLEANGLRALFKTYLDLMDLDQISLKIFLRTDIWRSVSEGGFREASHITRHMTLAWNPGALLHLVVRRIATRPNLLKYYGAEPDRILGDARQQREFFDSIVPDKVDVGKNPRTFEWLLGRVQDGLRITVPREVIHLLTEARSQQLAMLERGELEPPSKELLSRQAFREALLPVSTTRLDQTLYAEYPSLKSRVLAMEGEKTHQTPASLALLWGVSAREAQVIAQELVEVGFFEERGIRDAPTYWVPFLYRPALRLIQGKAGVEGDEPQEDGD